MIDPGGIPTIDGDLDALAGHATGLSTTGGDFADTGERIDSTWQGLAPVYTAPESAELFAGTGPVKTTTASVGEDVSAVGAALTAYVGEVRGIKTTLDSLRAQASTFVADMATHGNEWDDDEGRVGRNRELVEGVNVQVAAFMAAQRRCANAVNARYGGLRYTAENGDGVAGSTEYGYAVEQLNAATGEQDALQWGHAEQRDEGLWGDVKSYGGGIRDAAGMALTDLGALVSRNPETGQWGDWGAAGTAWTGLGMFVYALGVTTSPVGWALDYTVGVPGFEQGEAQRLVVDAGKSIIAYDTWGEDPARAGGMATFNIVSAVLGTKGAGAAVRGTGAAIQGSRLAAVAAAGTALVSTGAFLTRLPTVDHLALAAGRRIPGFTVPDLSATPRVTIPHHNDPPTPRATSPGSRIDLPDTAVDTPGGLTTPPVAPRSGSIGDALARTLDAPSTAAPSRREPGASVPTARVGDLPELDGSGARPTNPGSTAAAVDPDDLSASHPPVRHGIPRNAPIDVPEPAPVRVGAVTIVAATAEAPINAAVPEGQNAPQTTGPPDPAPSPGALDGTPHEEPSPHNDTAGGGEADSPRSGPPPSNSADGAPAVPDYDGDPDYRASDTERSTFANQYSEYNSDVDFIRNLKEQETALRSIPEADLVAVRGYTGNEFYREMNEALRTQDPDLLNRYDSHIRTVTSGLNQLPSYEGVVSRGITIDNPKSLADAIDRYEPGTTVQERAFVSTDTKSAFDGNVRFEIYSFTGSDVSTLSKYPTIESEVLFAPGTTFRVLERTFDEASGTWLIRMIEG